ncbi:MAG TPA: T9SS type A sorting domain-containing protein [Bacteroidia bacterium]|nr:T9SS type A sorting domain-containing protein [Bacteroidia bacterium]
MPNANMEAFACCPTGTFQYNCIATWTNPNAASPEYFNACGSGGGDVPANSAGNQTAYSGNGYVGLIIGWQSSNYREYCQVQLTSPLVAGQTYSVSYWVSLADGSQYSTNRFEAYLSPTAVSNGTTNVLPFTPQIAPSTGFLANKAGWEQVCGNFVAAGGERYLIIGNFKNSGSTTLNFVSAGLPFCQSGGYYYVDDASVTLGPGGCGILPVTLNHFAANTTDDGTVEVTWNVGPEDGVERYLLERSTITEPYKVVNDVLSRNNSAGNQGYAFQDRDQLSGTVFYRLKTVDRNGEVSQSEAVRVDIDGDIDAEGVKNFYPSPLQAGELVHVDYLLHDLGRLEVKIHDHTGRLVRQRAETLQPGLSRLDLETEGLFPGTYFVTLVSGNAVAHKRLIIRQ